MPLPSWALSTTFGRSGGNVSAKLSQILLFRSHGQFRISFFFDSTFVRKSFFYLQEVDL